MVSIGLFLNRVDRKSNAICRRRIVEKILVDATDLFFCNEVKNDFLSGNLQIFEQERDHFSHLRQRYGKVSLRIIKGDFDQISPSSQKFLRRDHQCSVTKVLGVILSVKAR